MDKKEIRRRVRRKLQEKRAGFACTVKPSDKGTPNLAKVIVTCNEGGLCLSVVREGKGFPIYLGFRPNEAKELRDYLTEIM